jgi:hypothetical protein
MMTPKEAFALVNGFLTSTRCQFQGLSEAARISEAMMVLNPDRTELAAAPKTSDQLAVDEQLKTLAGQRNERRSNEDAKTKPANHRSAS